MYRGSALVAQQLRVFFNKSQPQRVEGRYKGALAYPAAHLPGRLVGKGDSQNTRGLGTAPDNLFNTLGDDPGFAGSGSGEHQEGSVYCQNRLLLLGVEPLQMLHSASLYQ